MSATVPPTRPHAHRPSRGPAASYTANVLFVYLVFAILYLMLPVAVMALFSFNDPPGKSNVAWHGFSLDAWLHPFGVPGPVRSRPDERRGGVHLDDRRDGARDAVALALVRYRFRGSAPRTR